MQLLLTKSGQAAADVKKVKLADALGDIAEATDALAKSVGRKAGVKRATTPAMRQREALGACNAAFNAVHEQIAWFIDHTPNGPDRDHLLSLQAPFEALLARNPPPATAKAAPPDGGATPPPAAPT